jgi:hypothetical protein
MALNERERRIREHIRSKPRSSPRGFSGFREDIGLADILLPQIPSTEAATHAGSEAAAKVAEELGLVPEIPPPPELPEVPTIDDPEIAAARERQRQAELRRKGRRAAILTGGQGVTDPLGVVNRPQARSATLLGQ